MKKNNGKKTKTGLLLLTSNQEYHFNNVLFFSSSEDYCNFIWLCQRQNMIWKKIKTINDMYSLLSFVSFFMCSHTMYALYIKAIVLRQIQTDLLAHIWKKNCIKIDWNTFKFSSHT